MDLGEVIINSNGNAASLVLKLVAISCQTSVGTVIGMEFLVVMDIDVWCLGGHGIMEVGR